MQQLLERFLDWLPGNLDKPARILLILALAAIALQAIHRIMPRLREAVVARQGNREHGLRINTLSRVVRYVLTVIVSVVTGLLILGEFGISVAPILGAAGVVGIAVGFGAQSLVKDYFTGFFLLLENQIRIGDVVEAGGRAGLVEELTLRYLRLRDYSGNVHYIPNGNISIVTNMSLEYAYAVMDVGVAYGEDIDRVMEVMRRVGQALRQDSAFAARIVDEIEIAGVETLADSAVVIRCRIRVTPLEQWNVKREFLRRVKQAFDQEDIEIPFPHRMLIYPRPGGDQGRREAPTT